MPPESSSPARRILTRALIAALLAGAAAPVAWVAIDRVQANARIRSLDDLTGDPKAAKEALAGLYTHAGSQPSLVRALAERMASLPPAKADEALRVAAKSCEKAGEMDPQLAQAAKNILPRLNSKEQLHLVAFLGSASAAAKKQPDAPRNNAAKATDFDRAMAGPAAACVKAQLGAGAAEDAVKTITFFMGGAPNEDAFKAAHAAYLEYLGTQDGTALLKAVATLNGVGLWGADLAGSGLYDRWVIALCEAQGADTREWAITLLRPRVGGSPPLAAALDKLTRDGVPAVRLAALHAATEWVRPDGRTVQPAFAAAFAAATQDADPAVAREAWLVLGLLGGEVPATPANLATLPSPVAEAAYATLAKARPQDGALVGELIKILEAEGTQSVSAAHALTLCDAPAAKDALAKLLTLPSDAILRQLCQWRVLLASAPEAARAWIRRTPPALPAVDPLATAAAFAAKEAPVDLAEKLTDEASRRLRLAALEGLPAAGATFDTPGEDWGLAFYALAKAEKDPAKVAAHLRPLFGAKESVWRDQACLLAARRLDQRQATELARDLLSTPAEETMMSGALLAGLAKVHPKRVQGGSALFRAEHPEWTEEKLYALSDQERSKLGLSTLDALTDNLNRWSDARSNKDRGVLYATQIGLALRGEGQANLDALVFDPRIPASTVLLAMLAQSPESRAAALDILLGDDVQPPFVPRQLLADWRFGEVVAEFLPKDGPEAAPRISYWGDIHLQKLQFEQLRTWWRLRKNAEQVKK